MKRKRVKRRNEDYSVHGHGAGQLNCDSTTFVH